MLIGKPRRSSTADSRLRMPGRTCLRRRSPVSMRDGGQVRRLDAPRFGGSAPGGDPQERSSARRCTDRRTQRSADRSRGIPGTPKEEDDYNEFRSTLTIPKRHRFLASGSDRTSPHDFRVGPRTSRRAEDHAHARAPDPAPRRLGTRSESTGRRTTPARRRRVTLPLAWPSRRLPGPRPPGPDVRPAPARPRPRVARAPPRTRRRPRGRLAQRPRDRAAVAGDDRLEIPLPSRLPRRNDLVLDVDLPARPTGRVARAAWGEIALVIRPRAAGEPGPRLGTELAHPG